MDKRKRRGLNELKGYKEGKCNPLKELPLYQISRGEARLGKWSFEKGGITVILI